MSEEEWDPLSRTLGFLLVCFTFVINFAFGLMAAIEDWTGASAILFYVWFGACIWCVTIVAVIECAKKQ